MAMFAVSALIAFGPSVAEADDVPAPLTSDRGRFSSDPRKNNADASNAEATESRIDGFGTFRDSIPLATPPFHKIAPSLALTYRSSGGNGWAGVGWNLDGVGQVERVSPGRGAPRYDGSDIYVLDNEELVACVTPSCTTGGTHATKTESYLKIALTGTGTAARFTVTAKDGTKSVYAPVFVLPGPDGVAGTSDDLVQKWGLQTITDTTNNVVTYTWGANLFGGAWDYLDSIAYNGTNVKFHYEQRTDVENAAAGAGSLARVQGRLKTIDVKVSGSRARAYKLSYTTSAATSRSLLTSVQQFGTDAVIDAAGAITAGTSLPAIGVGYSSPGVPTFASAVLDEIDGFSENKRFITLDANGDGKSDMLEVWSSCFIGCSYKAVAWFSTGTTFTRGTEFSITTYNENSRFFAMDVNGDGKDDLIELSASSGKWKRSIFLSDGTTFAAGATDTSMKYVAHTTDDVTYVDSRFLTGDINGDGKTDLIEIVPYTCFLCSTKFNRVAWLSNGSGFTLASDDTGMVYDLDSQFYALDFNGDGKTDFVELEPAPFSQLNRRVWLSNGTSFTQAVSDTSDYSQSMKFLVMDVNGDGKGDLLEFTPIFGSTSRRKTFLSTGSSFTLGSSVTLTLSLAESTRMYAGDVNGDGRSDYFVMTPMTFVAKRTFYLSNGTDFVEGTSENISGASGHRYYAADIDGDGRTDMLELYDVYGSTKRLPWLAAGAFPDLLTSIGTGAGGTTTVSYSPSSRWSSSNNPPISQTVTAVTVADGRGGSSTTNYTYAGGLYDWANARAAGFAYQKETQPCITGESACPYTETWFKQDAALGKASRVLQSDGAGKPLSAKVFDYTINTAALPWTVLPTGAWDYAYVGTGATCPGADCKRKYTGRTFNGYGEVTQEVDYGNYDVSGDEETTTATFVPNTTAYVVNLPADVKTFQGVGTAGALLTETANYYDNATTWNAAPSAGLPTKTARWLSSPSAFVETKKEYDAYGNVTATVDPLNARTTFAFDATYHLYPVTTTNALLQAKAATWDGVCGAPLTSTNLNNQTTTFSYDALCRLVTRTSPGGKFETHVWASLGDANNQYEEVQRPAADGTANPWFSRRYFDGQRRTWREVKKGPDTTTGNIYSDTTYNARGQQASTTAPYYAGGTTYTTTYGYDALDRPTSVTFPGGAQQLTSYGLWSVTTTDELAHVKTDRFDAYGKRTAHDEVLSGVTKTTNFAYDARHALAQSTDPSSNLVTYTTDSLGRVRTMVDPSWGTFTYGYDGANNLTSQLDPKSQSSTFGYDLLGRKTSKTSPVGTVSWTYDQARAGFYNVGTLTTLTDGAGTKTLDSDVAGRVAKTVRTINGTSYTFQYGFDAGDRVLWTTYPDTDTLGTASSPLLYDSAGRLKTIPGYVTSAVYDARDQATVITNANSTVTTRTYSPQRGWLTGVATVFGSTTIQNLALTRNNKGLVSQVTSPVVNEGWTFGYDDLDRVTTATNASGATNNQSFTYDPIGNILTNSRISGTYTYGTRPHAVTAIGSNAFVYDSAGLMTSGSGRTMTWNGDNRLATVTSGGVTSTMTYDADGARIQQIEGTVTRRYLGDDYETDSTGNVTKYVSLGDILVARKEGSAKLWVHTDHLGSIQAETGVAGTEVQRRKFRPYGEILSDSMSVDFEPRGFAGERHDASGLVYLHARYYDPTLGRFISPDLIVDGTDTVGLNRHAYVGNNPVNATDPTGLAAVVNPRPVSVDAREKKDAPPPPPPAPPRPPSYPTEEVASSPAPAAPAPPPKQPSFVAKSNDKPSVRLAVARPSPRSRASGPGSSRPSETQRARGRHSAAARRSPISRPKDVHALSTGGIRAPLPTSSPFQACLDGFFEINELADEPLTVADIELALRECQGKL